MGCRSPGKEREVREQEFDEVEVMRRLQSGDTAALQQFMDHFWTPLMAFRAASCYLEVRQSIPDHLSSPA
jgi:hypothetical protein